MRATLTGWGLAVIVGLTPASAHAAGANPSLYERLGAAYGIAAVVDDFVERIEENEVLEENPWIKEAFQRVDRAGLKFRITLLVCQATGGPEKYTGRTMFESHKHLYVREEDWTAVAEQLKRALDRFDVPAREQGELLAIVGSLKKDIVLSGPLDGKTYVGQLAHAGAGDQPDTFSFLWGHAKSGAFEGRGVKSGIYKGVSSSGAVKFDVVCEGAAGETVSWSGTASGPTLEATARRARPGRPDETYVFRGNEVRPTPTPAETDED